MRDKRCGHFYNAAHSSDIYYESCVGTKYHGYSAATAKRCRIICQEFVMIMCALHNTPIHVLRRKVQYFVFIAVLQKNITIKFNAKFQFFETLHI